MLDGGFATQVSEIVEAYIHCQVWECSPASEGICQFTLCLNSWNGYLCLLSYWSHPVSAFSKWMSVFASVPFSVSVSLSVPWGLHWTKLTLCLHPRNGWTQCWRACHRRTASASRRASCSTGRGWCTPVANMASSKAMEKAPLYSTKYWEQRSNRSDFQTWKSLVSLFSEHLLDKSWLPTYLLEIGL